MEKDVLKEAVKFKVSEVHQDIVEKYRKRNPQFKYKADVYRHAIVLLDEEMRKEDGKDNLSVLIKKVALLEKSDNKSRTQMDVLIRLILELLSRSGSDLTWEDAEQEIRDRISSAVTKKSEVRNVKVKKQEQVENHFEEKLTVDSQKLKEVINSSPPETKNDLRLISDEDKITLRNGIPHKSVWIEGKEYFDEISWEQIPEHRMYDLS
ncbi:hypothetical protein [Bacillus toyonensis]|uniref:hypothetical protein n=1 Tax=Bacillus toyonensis TaxID=155322 RepID=UPI001C0B9BBE|nr:hypothetical protein [Bacillus toyonensis]MBU4642988.1 hypothetical protein [Bacillus toyonensis]